LARALALGAREVVRLGQDRLQRDLPRSIDEVDASRLTAWLGRPVSRVTRLGTTRGTTDRARLGLEGDGVPASVFVKLPATAPVIRAFGYLADLGENEVRFYRDLRPHLAIEAPACLAAEYAPRTKRFALVLDDLEARGATFADATTSLTVEQSRGVLSGLATLHGTYWRSPALDRVRANGADPLLPAITLSLRATARRTERDAPELVPPEGRPILQAYEAVARELDAGHHTVLHGDPHPGNCYFVEGRAGLLDWQVLRRGHPLRDVAYHLVLALAPEVRRAEERDLLDHYCAELAAAGGPSFGPDEAWSAYRRMAAAPYAAATFTVGLAGLQDDDIARAGLRKSAAAVVDLGTAEALGLG
jgi:aminoglycoside phosphotransferase (APT) family kinase protein